MPSRKRLLKLAMIVGCVFAVLAGLACYLLTSLVIYYSPKKDRLQAADFDRIAAQVPGGVEKVALISSDGVKIVAWYLPADLQPGAERWAVILTHGGGDDKRYYLPLAQDLRRQGFDLLLPDLRGHGESARSPNGLTLGITEGRDVAAAANFLASRKHIRHIAAGGVSMGGVATVMGAAAEPHIGPLIIESSSDQAQTVFDAVLGAIRLPAGEIRWGIARPLTTLGLWRMGAPWIDAWRGELPTLRLASDLAPRSVIFLFGDQDPFVNEAAVRRFSSRFKGHSKIVVFKDTQHGVYDRRPREFSMYVTDFLNDWRERGLQEPP